MSKHLEKLKTHSRNKTLINRDLFNQEMLSLSRLFILKYINTHSYQWDQCISSISLGKWQCVWSKLSVFSKKKLHITHMQVFSVTISPPRKWVERELFFFFSAFQQGYIRQFNRNLQISLGIYGKFSVYNLPEPFLIPLLKHLMQPNWPNDQEEVMDSGAVTL